MLAALATLSTSVLAQLAAPATLLAASPSPSTLAQLAAPGPTLLAAIDPLSTSASLLAALLPLLVVAGLLTLGLGVSYLLRRLAAVGSFRQLHPWIPLLHLGVWLPIAWVLQGRLVPALDGPRADARLLALLVLALAALPWLRNLFLGVVFALEARYRIGDDLRVAGVEGRLVGVGLRAIALRAHDGTDLVVPYERLAREPVVRLNLRGHDAPCDLHLDVPPGLAPARAVELARQAAALSRFASPRCPPDVFLAPRDSSALALRLQIRGYLFDRDHAERYRSDLVDRLHAAFTAELAPDHADRRPQ